MGSSEGTKHTVSLASMPGKSAGSAKADFLAVNPVVLGSEEYTTRFCTSSVGSASSLTSAAATASLVSSALSSLIKNLVGFS